MDLRNLARFSRQFSKYVWNIFGVPKHIAYDLKLQPLLSVTTLAISNLDRSTNPGVPFFRPTMFNTSTRIEATARVRRFYSLVTSTSVDLSRLQSEGIAMRL